MSTVVVGVMGLLLIPFVQSWSLALLLALWLALVWGLWRGASLVVAQLSTGAAARSTFGSAHWMTPRELRQTGLLNERSGIVLGRVEGRTLRDAGEGHVLLVGPSRGGGIGGRAGKGTTTVIPTLCEWTGDVVCLDVKGELAALTAAWRQAHGATVYRIDPRGTEAASQINLLETIRHDTPQALGDAEILARALIPDPGLGKPEARYFATGGARILASTFLWLRESRPGATMGDALAFLVAPMPMKARLAPLATSRHPDVRATAADLAAQPDSTRQPLWSTAVEGLALWRDPTIIERTSRSEVDLTRFQTGDTSTTLYLRLPEGQAGLLAPLVRAIVSIILTRAMERRPDRTRRPLLLLLDEFAALGPCPPLVDALPRMAGYGLRCCLVLQDLSDLTRLYGREHSIVQNCATRCFMTPNDPGTATYISRLVGITTVGSPTQRTGESRSWQGAAQQSGESWSAAARTLLTVDEVLRWHECDVLVCLSGQPPLRAQKITWDDPVYTRCVMPGGDA